MRVATCNIRFGEGGLDRIIDVLGGLDAEVLALQELDVGVPRTLFRHQPRAIARALGYEFVFVRASRVGLVGRHGIALLTRTAVAEVERIPLPRRGRRSTPRVGMVADIGALRVATGHLSIKREEAQPQLEVLGRALTSRRPPWLLLGDLNLRPPDVARVLEPLGLTMTSTHPPTYPAAAPTFAIDHVAAGGGAGVVDGSVAAVESAVSDHRPLVADVR